jgi:hypothetical protein
VPDEIADDFDLICSVRKFNEELFFDQYQQLESTEGIKVKIVTEVHFILAETFRRCGNHEVTNKQFGDWSLCTIPRQSGGQPGKRRVWAAVYKFGSV